MIFSYFLISTLSAEQYKNVKNTFFFKCMKMLKKPSKNCLSDSCNWNFSPKELWTSLISPSHKFLFFYLFLSHLITSLWRYWAIYIDDQNVGVLQLIEMISDDSIVKYKLYFEFGHWQIVSYWAWVVTQNQSIFIPLQAINLICIHFYLPVQKWFYKKWKCKVHQCCSISVILVKINVLERKIRFSILFFSMFSTYIDHVLSDVSDINSSLKNLY